MDYREIDQVTVFNRVHFLNADRRPAEAPHPRERRTSALPINPLGVMGLVFSVGVSFGMIVL
jgi:hypothetical protein